MSLFFLLRDQGTHWDQKTRCPWEVGELYLMIREVTLRTSGGK